MLCSGMTTVKKLLFVFLLIGILTAFWRMSGTIPVIIAYALRLIRPKIFYLMCFLLCCGLSFLTGTSVGSAATIGVICMSLSVTMGMNPMLTGGAILSGVYFGDRCSPVSTSAMLVCQLTSTVIYDNIKNMMKTALVPFILTCVFYLVLGLSAEAGNADINASELFQREFNMTVLAVLPALIILVLAVFRVQVAYTMEASIVCAFIISLVFQKYDLKHIAVFAVCGFEAFDTEVGRLMNGGGLLSIAKMFFAVMIASSYKDIFIRTGLLDAFQSKIHVLCDKTTRYFAVFCVSLVSCAVACNQSFATILTNQLCGDMYDDASQKAADLEDSVIVVAAMIPWSIACSAVISASGAPALSSAAAIYIYLIPAWRILISFVKKH